MHHRDKTKLKPRLMQFSSRSYNSTFEDKKDHTEGIQIDNDIFMGLVTERDFDSKLKQLKSHKNNEQNRGSISPELKPQSLMERYIQLVRTASNQITSLKDSNDLQQFCNHFQINQKKLVQLTTVEERESYVIKCMNENIDQHIQNFIQKQTERQLCLEDEKRIEQVRQQQTEKVKNLFEWLSIKTKYTNLKKKLTYALVETINDNKNQNNIKSFFSKKNSEKDILTLRKSIKSKSNSAYSGANTAVTFNSSPARPTTSVSKQTFIELEPKITQIDTHELKAYAPTKWSTNLEKKYKDFKEQARINLQESAGNNKSALGIYPLIQSLCKDKLGQGLWSKKRDEIFNKFTNGEILDPTETEFIANTSSLLNSCMDKQFIQSTIKNMDQQLLEKLEFQIAENTLKFYETLIQEFDKTRTSWLENLNHKRLDQIKKKSVELERRFEQPQKIEQQKRIRNKLIAVLKDIQRKKEHRQERQKQNLCKLVDSAQDAKQIQKNKYVYLFVEKMLKVIRRNVGQKYGRRSGSMEFILRNSQKPRNEPSEELKRNFHPSSKLFVKPTKVDERGKDTKQNQKVMKQIKIKEIERFKIKILERKPSQEQFQNFYTGGPKSERVYANKNIRGQVSINQENEHLQPKNGWITRDIEIKAINKIKASLRSYILRKKYLRLIEDRKQKQQVQLQRRIKKIVESSKFMIGVQQQLKKLHDPTEDTQPVEPQQIYQRLRNSQSVVVTQRQQQKSPPKARDPVQELNERLRILQKKHKSENNAKDFLQETRLKTRKLLLAAKMKNLNIALQSGYKFTVDEVNCRDLLNNTPLFYSAQHGDENFCKYLIELGADINAKCENGNTPTHMAFKSNNSVVIVMFLQLNADLNILNDEGNTPIAYASMSILNKLNMGNQVATVERKATVTFDNNLINKVPYKQKTLEPSNESVSDRIVSPQHI